MDDIRIRDHELTEIANSIASLAELFKDLSTLVIDQGTLLDSVEYNIEQTSVHVADAVKELNIATRYVVHPHVLPARTEPIKQVSEKYRSTQDHISSSAYYIWINSRTYLQTSPSPSASKYAPRSRDFSG